jgi:type IV fimbrial biogenesis protein FimT
MSHRRGPVAQRGLSLVEQTITLAIAALAVGSALPGLDRLRQAQQLEGMAARLQTELHYARSIALERRQGTRLSFEALPQGGWCYVIHTGGSRDCRCDHPDGARCSSAAEALRHMHGAHSPLRQLSSNSRSLLFDPALGTVTPTASIDLQDNHGRSLRLVVSIMGRVRSCSPEGSLPGHKPC